MTTCTQQTPPNHQPLSGGNVYILDDKDDAYDASARHELLVIGAMAGITLLAGLVGVCIILGYGLAHILGRLV